MTVDIMRGVGVTRRRGTEAGGILLGQIRSEKIDSAAEPVVMVYDYEIVPCEYSQGPSYILSERDLEVFRAAIERWRREISPDQYVVGYFRSHTRDGHHLQEDDVTLFHTFFKDPLAVALLIKPYVTKVSEAGFFLQSNGKLEIEASPLEFSFVRAQEAIPQAPPRPVPSPAAPQSKPIEPAVVEAPASEIPPLTLDRPTPQIEKPAAPLFRSHNPSSKRRWRERALWVVFTLAVLGFGAVAGSKYVGGPVRPVEAGSPGGDPYNVALSATAQNQSVLVRWNGDAEAVKTALRGALTISEGAASKEVRLDTAELRNGTVLYHPLGGEISFKLELFFRENRSFAESVTLGIQ